MKSLLVVGLATCTLASEYVATSKKSSTKVAHVPGHTAVSHKSSKKVVGNVGFAEVERHPVGYDYRKV